MSNSPLVTYTLLSPNRTHPRNHVIDTITIHCIVGQVTAKRGCEIFQNTKSQSSANYVVGYDGSIGLCVDEGDRSWCSGGSLSVNGITGKMNDHRAVTIEVASDTTHPYAVTDAALESLIRLVADIAKRNGMGSLRWKGDKTLVGNPAQQNMTVHRWFANKACPGDYLYNLHGEIARRANEILEGDRGITRQEAQELITEAVQKLTPKVYTTLEELPDWAQPMVQRLLDEGIIQGDGTGKLHLTDHDLGTVSMVDKVIQKMENF